MGFEPMLTPTRDLLWHRGRSKDSLRNNLVRNVCNQNQQIRFGNIRINTNIQLMVLCWTLQRL